MKLSQYSKAKPFVGKTKRRSSKSLRFALVTLCVSCVISPFELHAADSSSQIDTDYVAVGNIYDAAKRRSVYVSARDGTRIAVDYYLPSGIGKAESDKFPVVLYYTRYSRGGLDNEGNFVSDIGITVGPDGSTMLTNDDTQLGQTLLRHGYAVAVAEVRGAGASFGPSHFEGDDVEGKDGKAVVDWLGRQSWSTGKVGMYGLSYPAEIQPRVAAERPSALKALVMAQAFFDGVNSAYGMGGIYRAGWLGTWEDEVAVQDSRTAESEAGDDIVPVDGDESRNLLRQAILEHRRGPSGMEYSKYLKDFHTVGILRDKVSWIDKYQSVGQNNLSTLVSRVNAANIPTLLFGGWNDLYATDMLLWNANLTVPHRLIYGPWTHGDSLGPAHERRNIEYARLRTNEALRWFDRFLKGVNNDALAQPAIRLEVAANRSESIRLTSPIWPVPGTATQSYRLAVGPSYTVRSQNDGRLLVHDDIAANPGAPSSDKWAVDYATTTGTAGSRWWWGYGYIPIEMTSNDYRSLTYTTAPLTGDLMIIGNPVVTLYLSSADAPVIDVYAMLSEVDTEGYSRLVTEGMLRSSHRTLGTAPYNNLGLPFPTSLSKDVAHTAPLGTTPAKLNFAMIATGKIFKKGNRIRLTVMGNDRGNTTTPELTKRPQLTLHLDGSTPSVLDLPVVPIPPSR